MAYLVVVMAYDFALIPVPAESDPIPSPDPSSLAHDLEQSPLGVATSNSAYVNFAFLYPGVP